MHTLLLLLRGKLICQRSTRWDWLGYESHRLRCEADCTHNYATCQRKVIDVCRVFTQMSQYPATASGTPSPGVLHQQCVHSILYR